MNPETRTRKKTPAHDTPPAPNAPVYTHTVDTTDLTGSVDAIERGILHHVKCSLARDTRNAKIHDWWAATCLMARDRALDRFIPAASIISPSNTSWAGSCATT